MSVNLLDRLREIENGGFGAIASVREFARQAITVIEQNAEIERLTHRAELYNTVSLDLMRMTTARDAAQAEAAKFREALAYLVEKSEELASYAQSQWADDNCLSQETHWLNVARGEAIAALSHPAAQPEVTITVDGQTWTAGRIASLCEAIWPGKPKWVPTPDHPQQDFYEGFIESLRYPNEDAPAKPKACPYGDPYCPCQDGDMCHYSGPNPMTPPQSGKVK